PLDHLSLVTIRKAQDHLMDASHLCSFNDRLVLPCLKAADIGGDSISKKFDVLWQIADILPEHRPWPFGDVGIIEPDCTGRWRKHSDYLPRECRLPSASWSNDPEDFALFDAKSNSTQNRPRAAARCINQAFDTETA